MSKVINYEISFRISFISKNIYRLVLSFVPINDAIYSVRVKGKFHNIKFINVYAPNWSINTFVSMSTKVTGKNTLMHSMMTCSLHLNKSQIIVL